MIIKGLKIFVVVLATLLSSCASKVENNVDFTYKIRAAANINPNYAVAHFGLGILITYFDTFS